jgi:MFS family permease
LIFRDRATRCPAEWRRAPMVAHVREVSFSWLETEQSSYSVAAATLLMIGVGMIVALLPQRVHAETGSLESVGLVASVFAFAYLLAQLPAGILADRLGVRSPCLSTGTLLCAVAGVVFFVSETARRDLSRARGAGNG